MAGKKSGALVRMFGVLLLLAIVVYLFFFAARVLRFFGVTGAAINACISAAFGALCLLAVVIRPIPVKFAALTVVYVLTFSLIADLLHLLFAPAAPVPSLWSALYESGALVLPASAAMLLYGWLHGKRVYRKHYRLAVSAPLPGGRLRVAMLSDVHMGKSVDAEKLRAVCARITAEQPDIFVLAGDLCDDQTAPEDMLAACRLAGEVKAAYGTFFVYGNHDLGGHGPPLRYAADALRQALAENGVTILDDSSISLTVGLCIVGRRDAWLATTAGGRMPLPELLSHADGTKPVILLDHQPLDTKLAARCGVKLQLCGHTHAGQVWPASMLGRLIPITDVFYGHKTVENCHVVVSSGLGCRGTTLRSGSNAEYVIVDLVS